MYLRSFVIHVLHHVCTRCLEVRFLASNSPDAVSILEEPLLDMSQIVTSVSGTFWNESRSHVVQRAQDGKRTQDVTEVNSQVPLTCLKYV